MTEAMLFGALTVVVVLASGEPDGAAPAMEQALAAALPENARVLVRPRGDASEGTWLARGKDESAALVGVVTWSEKQRRVVVRFVRPEEGRWSDREIRFDAGDAASERGRTVGFALASMVPEEVLAKAVAENEATRGASARATSGPPSPPPPSPPPPSPAAAPPQRRQAEAPPLPPLPVRNRPAVEATGLAATALGGYGGGLGAALALRIPLGDSLRLRASVSARAGDVPVAQASSRVLGGAVGLAWQTWVDDARRWSAGARVEALLQHHELAHFSSDDPEPAAKARWLPGAGAAIEVGWRFTEQAAVVGAGGLEAVFGRSAVFVGGQEVAALTPLRLVGEVGLRVSF